MIFSTKFWISVYFKCSELTSTLATISFASLVPGNVLLSLLYSLTPYSSRLKEEHQCHLDVLLEEQVSEVQT